MKGLKKYQIKKVGNFVRNIRKDKKVGGGL